ncbi:MAG: CPBP family intramembrane glutamic endopeptidase [Tepidisphaeraceae bacterium]
MSIFLALADSTAPQIPGLILPMAAVMALAVAVAIGVFKPRTILGPQRLSPGESPRILIGTIGFALLAWALCQLVLGASHQRLLAMHHQPPTAPPSDAEKVIYVIVMDAAVLAAALVATLSRPEGARRSGINLARLPRGFLGGIFAIAIVLPLIDCLGGLTELMLKWLHKSPPPHDLLQILSDHPAPWLRAADVLSACVLAPLAEEMFFRGLVQTALRYLLNRPWLAVFLTAALFAMVHPWWTWPEIFFLGISLGYVYERTGNLWISVTTHALFNLTSIWLFVHFG